MNRMVDTLQNDRVQDGRHLMNGDRWVTGEWSTPPAGTILGVRPAPLVFHRDAFSLVWPMPARFTGERTGEPLRLNPRT
jgi:hypothetical protein